MVGRIDSHEREDRLFLLDHDRAGTVGRIRDCAQENQREDHRVHEAFIAIPGVVELELVDHVDLAEEKKKWLKLLDGYEHFSNEGFIHPFFGTMTKEDTGLIVYKHIDHHLRQFNC